jgi:hypothetical protein
VLVRPRNASGNGAALTWRAGPAGACATMSKPP